MNEGLMEIAAANEDSGFAARRWQLPLKSTRTGMRSTIRADIRLLLNHRLCRAALAAAALRSGRVYCERSVPVRGFWWNASVGRLAGGVRMPPVAFVRLRLGRGALPVALPEDEG